MSIVKMKFVACNTDKQNLDEMLLATVKSKLLDPEPAVNIINDENGGKLILDENIYESYLSSLKNISHSISVELNNEKPINTYTKEEIEAFIKEIEEQIILSGAEEYFTADDSIALKNLNEYGFEKIHSSKFLNFGFGRLPKDSLKKLNLYSEEPFILETLHQNKQYYWVLYATSNTFFPKIKKIFNSLFLENINIPDIDIEKVRSFYKDKLNDIYNYCYLNNELYKLHKYVLIMDNKHVICGFVPENKIDEFKSYFKDLPVDFRVKEPSDRSDLKAPTLLKNNSFFKPFELFVNMYSTPSYKEIDPTVFVGITYCILFGLMFGDLGQGFVLFLIGTIMYKKTKNNLMGIISRIGISSMIFGFLFGSVFGNEELLNPIHQQVFNVKEKLFEVMSNSSTMALLIGAVSIGAILILITMIINIYINIKNKEIGEVLFSQNGISGFVLYGYVIAAAVCKFMLNINILTKPYLLVFVLIPIILFFFKEPLTKIIEKENPKPKGGWGNFVLETFFEVFEIMLSFVTNSLSYLRVGGFILSHAGMMLVVMTLVNMVGKSGVVVFILGNIFVMVLEGLIVGIQTLRLEYYEMFSRYYKGGGREYKILSYEN